VTWATMGIAGMVTTACQKVLSAPNPAMTLPLQFVVPRMSDVTAASLAVVGMVTTACQKAQSAPLHATPQSPQCALAPLMLYVT